MNMRNVKLTAEIAKLTVAQAHKAFFRAIKDANMTKADELRHFLRLASGPLRAALDLIRHEIAHPGKALSEAQRLTYVPEFKARQAQIEANLLADLGRIKEVIDWRAEALRQPEGPTLGEALALAGLRTGERA